MELTIYVPREGKTTPIDARSAVVGNPAGEDRVDVHFEGARFAAMAFAEKLVHAAGRLVQRYPTTARATLAADSLTAVGAYDTSRWCVTRVDDPAALAAWAGEEIGEIVGASYPAGPFPEGAALPGPEAMRPVHREGMRHWYRTRAGQFLAYDAATRRSVVVAHDDPTLPATIASQMEEAR